MRENCLYRPYFSISVGRRDCEIEKYYKVKEDKIMKKVIEINVMRTIVKESLSGMR